MSERRSRLGTSDYTRLHLRFGWWSLFGFLGLGLVLESLHGFKVGWYVNVSSETRRLMWTLGHAHGTLFSLVHVVLALALQTLRPTDGGWLRIVSPCLIGASVLLPGGFLLGGAWIYAGDPGVGVFLVPVGALLMLIGVFLAARHLGSPGVDR